MNTTDIERKLNQEAGYLASFLGRCKEDEYHRIMKRLAEIRTELEAIRATKESA